jgi:hypothetical protein
VFRVVVLGLVRGVAVVAARAGIGGHCGCGVIFVDAVDVPSGLIVLESINGAPSGDSVWKQNAGLG